jgi:hypothetical protein
MQRGLSRSAQVVRAPIVTEERRTADVLVDILVDAGVEVVFGIPGGSVRGRLGRFSTIRVAWVL